MQTEKNYCSPHSKIVPNVFKDIADIFDVNIYNLISFGYKL